MKRICTNTLCPLCEVPVETDRCHVCQRMLVDGELQARTDEAAAHVLAATLTSDHPALD